MDGTGLQPVRNGATQQEVSSGERAKLHLPPRIAPLCQHSRLNHPSMEKLSSTKRVPGARKVGDRCFVVVMLILKSIAFMK